MLLSLNNVFLMTVAFMPFPASLLGEYPEAQAAIVLYGCTLIAANGFLALSWFYADRAGLLHPAVPVGFRKFAVRVTLAPILIYLLAIAVWFANLKVPLALFAAVPAYFIIPHRFVARRVTEAIAAVGDLHASKAPTCGCFQR